MKTNPDLHATQTRQKTGAFRRLAMRHFPLSKRLIERIYPFLQIAAAVLALGRSGRRLKMEAGTPIHRQIKGLAYAIFGAGLPAVDFYLYRLDRLQDHCEGLNYLPQRLFIKWLVLLNRKYGLPPQWSKVAFHSFCRQHKLPTIPIITVFERGVKVEREEWLLTYPGDDVYCKPAFGYCGLGIERWEWRPGEYCRRDQALKIDEFEETLRHRSIKTTYLVQPRIRNHPRLEGLSNGTLCTVRFTTVTTIQGAVRGFMPSLKMAHGSNEKDNFSQGNIVAAIDMDTGVLQQAYVVREGVACSIDRHPDTGLKIKGIELPYWDEIKSLSVRAQSCLEDGPATGWDVAVTQVGPVLLEGNRTFGIELLQVGHCQGVGRSDLIAELYEIMRSTYVS